MYESFIIREPLMCITVSAIHLKYFPGGTKMYNFAAQTKTNAFSFQSLIFQLKINLYE